MLKLYVSLHLAGGYRREAIAISNVTKSILNGSGNGMLHLRYLSSWAKSIGVVSVLISKD
jgi:hypothetical protein